MRENIEAERGRMQLTKEEIAEQLGVTPKTYLSYVRGGSMPVEKAIKMSRLFSCSIDYLLGLTDVRTRIS